MSERRSSKGRDKIVQYIANRVMGINKTASARNAGYKQPNSRVTNIEKTNNFREITSQILADNSVNAILLIEGIRKRLDSKELEKYPLDEMVKILLNITTIQKNLSPDLRIKETIDDKGKVTRTMWNTASPMQSQNILNSQAQSNVAQSTFGDTEKPLINNDVLDTTPTAQA